MNITKIEELQKEIEFLKKENESLKYSFQEDIKQHIQTEEALQKLLSLTDAAFESIHSGILVIDNEGKVLKYNSRFSEMWCIPEDILNSGEDKLLLDYAVQKLADPQEFISKVEELYNTPDAESYDILYFTDGLIFERISKPMYSQGEPKGRVWSFFDITERKRTEDALIRSQYLYRLLADNISDIIWILDFSGKYLYISPSVERLSGFTVEEVMTNPVINFYTPGSQQIVAEHLMKFNQLLTQNVPLVGVNEVFQLEALRKDGSSIWIEVRESIIYSEHEKQHIIVGSTININDRKKKEEMLSEREEYFRAIFENSSSSMLIVETDTSVSMANEELCRLSGYSKQEMKEMSWTQVVHPEDLERMMDYNKKRLIDPYSVPDKYEARMFTKFGELRYVLLSTSLLSNYKLIVSLVDITERKRMEEALKDSEGKLKLLSSMASEMLNLHDPDSIYKYIADNLSKQLLDTIILCISIDEPNKITTFESVAGISNNLLKKVLSITGFNPVGKTYKLIPSHYEYFNSGNLYEYIGGLAGYSGPEFPNIAAKAIEKLIGLHKIYSIGIKKENKLLAAIHFFTFNKKEIHETNFIEAFIKQAGTILQKKLSENALILNEIKLKEINSQKDKFFSIIAHDIKGPFTGFLGLTKVISEEFNELTMSELQEISLNLHESANNLYKLLENLLEWSRMQRGVTAFNPDSLLLHSLVYQNINIVHEFAKQKEITLFNLIPDNLYVTADIPMLNTVFRNLISNAIKFTPRAGKIEIGANIKSSKASEDKIIIYVKDNGIGIDENTIDKLFQIDQKISRPGTENEPSTGLGLLLCKEFIEKHGGNIWAESKEGKGTTFYFTLAEN
ncbi:MAG: PAS domain S-box protein [Candidatus Kapabacteria bacterium]|nr:PAS domain S-box protein [Candidatus Kapabacteria bacterium]